MNRRRFFDTLLPEQADASKATAPQAFGSAPLQRFVPGPDGPWDYAKAAHLLRRAVAGPTHAEILRAVFEGPTKTIDRLLKPFTPSTAEISDIEGHEPLVVAGQQEGEIYDEWFWEKLGKRFSLSIWWLKTMVESPTSVQERMTFFWHDMIPIQMGKVDFSEWAYVNNQLLRSHALGNVRNLIGDVTTDASMLIYLDGMLNNKFTVNENYARELLELFTCGRTDRHGNPNYTEKDVRECARALTGWAIVDSKTNGHGYKSLDSFFWPHLWDDGPKTLLGSTGNWDTQGALDVIFSRRGEQVAWHLCSNLYRRFVSLQRDDETVAAMADLLIRSDWDVAPVLRALFACTRFYEPINRGCLPKSFMDYHVGLIRSLGLEGVPDFESLSDPIPYRDLYFRLERYDHLPFSPPNVSGWPDGRAWVSPANLVPRLTFARDVMRGEAGPVYPYWSPPCYTFDVLEFARGFSDPYDPDLLCDEIAQFFLAVPPSPDERKTLMDALLGGGPAYEWDPDDPDQRAGERIRSMLEALVQLPKFQLY